MKNCILKPPPCAGNHYRRSDYGAGAVPQVNHLSSRCYIPLISSRLTCYSPAASLLCVVSLQQSESMGECRHVH